MAKLYEISFDSGDTGEILFAAPLEAGATAFTPGEEIIHKGTTTLTAAIGMIRSVGQAAIDSLRGLDVESAEATVGLKLSAKGKFVVAEAAAEAALSVKFKIRPRS